MLLYLTNFVNTYQANLILGGLMAVIAKAIQLKNGIHELRN